MKSVFLSLAVAFILIAVPARAQQRAFDLTGYVAWVDTSSEGTFGDNNNPIDVNFDGTMGYGIGANIFWGSRISTEFAIVRVQNDLNFRTRTINTSATEVEMMPITAILQFHLAPSGRIDPYIGAGAAYVLFGDVDRPAELSNIDFERLDFEDDFGFALNAGVGIKITNNFGLTLDAKYVPLESSATAVRPIGDADVKFDMNPVIFSAGATLRF